MRCPHCGSIWNDRQKNANVRKLRAVATQPFSGVAGFYINELYASWGSSRLSRLVERYLGGTRKAAPVQDVAAAR